MSAWAWLAIAAGATVVSWVAAIAGLALLGRREDARALAGLVPDCAVLFRRLLGDPRVPRSRKLALAALLVYLASPIDLVPDFIPVAGQLDDAILVAVVLRFVLRAAGPELVTEHWPGPPASRRLILRLAGFPGGLG